MSVAGRGGGLIDIAHIDHGLRGEQPEPLEGGALVVGDFGQPGGLALAQQRQRALDQIERLLGFFVLAAQLLLELRQAALEAVEIGQHQLGLDGVGVLDRVDAALDMNHVVVLEAAKHIGDGIDLADVGEELVAEPFALGGAAHQPGDVDEGQPCGDHLSGLGNSGELVEARVGDRNLADIRLDGAERVVGGLRRGALGQSVEQGGLADIGQPDDAAFESHDLNPS